MVEQVEEFSPEIDAHAFAWHEVLDDGKVGIHEIGTESGVRLAFPSCPAFSCAKQFGLNHADKVGLLSTGLLTS